MTRQADMKARVRERMAKTGESYTAARARLLAGAGALHVTNGDSTVMTLRRTGLATRIVAWRDALHEGPVPQVGDRELRELRARFLAGGDGPAAARVRRSLEERDRALAAGRDGDYVLWFEADLYDQLQLAQILARLAQLRVAPGCITLICIGEHLGIAHFGGLGELDPEQLAELPARAAVTLGPDALELAGQAWAALRAPDPRGLGAIAAARSADLRFLPEAFDRLSREYPSARDGLSLTERRLLAAVAAGAATAGEAFVRAAAREARPFLGDVWAYAALERLTRAQTPLLAADGTVERHTRLRVTDVGTRVLAGAQDHVALNGVDRWVGGVHLFGGAVPWRWDDGVEALVAV
jgi:plasmid stabilization system protein ParE